MGTISRIIRAEAFRLGGDERPIHNQDGPEDAVIVRLTDEEGRQGIGEADAAAPVIQAFLDMPSGTSWSRNILEQLIGADPLDVGALWEKFYRTTIYTGRRGAGIHALSAVDVALHDLAARQLGVPVWKLLGGARRENLQPYATIWQGRPKGRPINDQLAVVEKQMGLAKEAGFRAVKFEVPFEDQVTDRQLADIIRWGRKTVGDDVTLMVDFCYRWDDWTNARRLLDRIVDCDIAFAEATLQHDDLDGHAKLAAVSPIPIAGGEFAATRWELREWIVRGGVHILQPGLARSGGFTELRRICDMAELAGVKVVPHGWKTGITDVAGLHLQAIANSVPTIEWMAPHVYDSPLRRHLIAPEPSVKDGVTSPPIAPGLGIEIDTEFVERYTTKHIERRA